MTSRREDTDVHAVNQFGTEGLAYQVGNRAAFLVGFLDVQGGASEALEWNWNQGCGTC